MYLCVDKDGSFRVAESLPVRWHHFDKIIEECENFYGKFITIEKDDLSKPHEDSFWAVQTYDYGEYVYLSPHSIKKESLNKDLQKLTWLDEPVEI